MKYKIQWTRLGLKLTKYMSLAISIPFAIFMVIRFFSTGMSIEKTFEHISLVQLPLFFLGICVFSAVFAFLIALLMKLCAIEIKDGKLIGRNYWGFKKTIPIAEIINLYPFNNNGLSAIVADGETHGEVFIYTYTDSFEKIIQHLEQNIINYNA